MAEEMNIEKFNKLASTVQDAGRKFIVMFEDADGNWRGHTKKFDKDIFAREVGPETILQVLLTHNGQETH